MSEKRTLQAAPGSSFRSSVWDRRLSEIFSRLRLVVSKASSDLSKTRLAIDCKTIFSFRKANPGYQGERALMHAGHGGNRICSLRWAGALSDSHVVGLFLHEFGHLSGGESEPRANEWVKRRLGITIEYKGPLDLQWVEPRVVRQLMG